ncbi:hypothetical protein [Spiroplasma endosymbiont of Polydrusus formosus]|uniref:hypothetical protein n=1 Tax=Spiroplasma endosymbiont of Polydrusus formosus TaxID=3139326 RepID=UPI0035B51B0B
MMRNIIIFCAYGNIGQQALQIIESNPNYSQLTAVDIYHNVAVLHKILQKHQIIKLSILTMKTTKQH